MIDFGSYLFLFAGFMFMHALMWPLKSHRVKWYTVRWDLVTFAVLLAAPGIVVVELTVYVSPLLHQVLSGALYAMLISAGIAHALLDMVDRLKRVEQPAPGVTTVPAPPPPRALTIGAFNRSANR